MKVIFLDIDGVLNSQRYINSVGRDVWDNPANQMDPIAVQRLNRFTDATGAKLVISSTWRLHFVDAKRLDLMQECIASYGITGDVIGMTPARVWATRNRRGKEIQEWIDNHYKELDRFVIVDDDVDMGRLGKFQVKTQFDDGLQDHHLVAMAKMLDQEDDWRPVVEAPEIEVLEEIPVPDSENSILKVKVETGVNFGALGSVSQVDITGAKRSW